MPHEVHLSEPIGAFNTFVLICSSVTVVLAFEAAKANKTGEAKGWMVAHVPAGQRVPGRQGATSTTPSSPTASIPRTPRSLIHEKPDLDTTPRPCGSGCGDPRPLRPRSREELTRRASKSRCDAGQRQLDAEGGRSGLSTSPLLAAEIMPLPPGRYSRAWRHTEHMSTHAAPGDAADARPTTKQHPWLQAADRDSRRQHVGQHLLHCSPASTPCTCWSGLIVFALMLPMRLDVAAGRHDREHRPVLALRRSGVDLPVSVAVLVLEYRIAHERTRCHSATPAVRMRSRRHGTRHAATTSTATAALMKYIYVFIALCVLTGVSFFTYSDFWRETVRRPAAGP